MPATPLPSRPTLPPDSQITENGEILTDQNDAPQTDPNLENFTTNPPDLMVPPPNSNTPSPSHTNSGRPSPNYLRGSVEFPPGGSPVPPGTNLSTDYSSSESLNEACAEHAEKLLRIVTPPELGEESESEGEGEGEGGGEGVEVGSVRVSEWGLEHILKLRGEGEGEEEEEEGGSEVDTLTPGDCERARQESKEIETERSDSSTAQGTPPPPESPFSLSCLGLPTTPSTPATTPQLEGPMSWWAEALAETENMEDMDALVDQLKGESSTAAERKREEGEREGGVDEGEEAAKKAEEEDREEDDSPKQLEGGADSPRDHTPLPPSTVDENPASPDPVVTATKTTPIPSRSPSPSPSVGSAHSEEVAYIAQAGRLIRKALQFEQEREFEEAFDLFKAAVDVLLNGVQSEGVT